MPPGVISYSARCGFGLVTLHRPSNVDDPDILAGLVRALATIARELPLVFVVHPRTRGNLTAAGLADVLATPGILATAPLGYLDMIGLLRDAKLVVTDSGGVQEETTALGVPCLTVRDNTERPITITEGTNTLVGTKPEALIAAARQALSAAGRRGRIPELWDGRAAHRVAARVLDFVAARREGRSAPN